MDLNCSDPFRNQRDSSDIKDGQLRDQAGENQGRAKNYYLSWIQKNLESWNSFDRAARIDFILGLDKAEKQEASARAHQILDPTPREINALDKAVKILEHNYKLIPSEQALQGLQLDDFNVDDRRKLERVLTHLKCMAVTRSLWGNNSPLEDAFKMSVLKYMNLAKAFLESRFKQDLQLDVHQEKSFEFFCNFIGNIIQHLVSKGKSSQLWESGRDSASQQNELNDILCFLDAESTNSFFASSEQGRAALHRLRDVVEEYRQATKTGGEFFSSASLSELSPLEGGLAPKEGGISPLSQIIGSTKDPSSKTVSFSSRTQESLRSGEALLPPPFDESLPIKPDEEGDILPPPLLDKNSGPLEDKKQ